MAIIIEWLIYKNVQYTVIASWMPMQTCLGYELLHIAFYREPNYPSNRLWIALQFQIALYKCFELLHARIIGCVHVSRHTLRDTRSVYCCEYGSCPDDLMKYVCISVKHVYPDCTALCICVFSCSLKAPVTQKGKKSVFQKKFPVLIKIEWWSNRELLRYFAREMGDLLWPSCRPAPPIFSTC